MAKKNSNPAAGDPAAADALNPVGADAADDTRDDPEPAEDAEIDQLQAAIDAFKAQLADDEREAPGADLFAEACLAYGLQPDPNVRPVEILRLAADRRWKFERGNDLDGVPDRVVFVTAGGLKVAHPMDEGTVERLLITFHCKGIDTKGNETLRPLPEDLTLPRTIVSGIPPRTPEKPRLSFLQQAAQTNARRGLR